MAKFKTGIITYDPTDNIKEMQVHAFLSDEKLLNYDMELRASFLALGKPMEYLLSKTMRESDKVTISNMNCPLRGGVNKILKAHSKFEEEVRARHERHNKDTDK